MICKPKPRLCLSIRQPWAWLIVNGWKPVENRTWATKFTGRVLIHAGKAMTRKDYDACLFFVMSTGSAAWQALPGFDSPQLHRGGIVGESEITACVAQHPSPWFEGPYGFVLDTRQSRPLPFVPCKGALKFFIRPRQDETS